MTAVQYRESHGLEYIGKHSKKLYKVWRMLSCNGPIVVTEVYGTVEANKLCSNCYYSEITEIKEKNSSINI